MKSHPPMFPEGPHEINVHSHLQLESIIEEDVALEKDGDGVEEEIILEKAKDCPSAPQCAAAVSPEGSTPFSPADTTPEVPEEIDGSISVEPVPSDDNTALRVRAVWVMLFCIFTDSVNVLCTHPNFAIMVSPGAHPDSFPNTEPFDFATAQYMIVSAASAGTFVANLGAGWLSDHVGRRRLVLINLAASVVFTLAKYGARHDYWTFVAMAFVNGCFASTPTVGLGYISDMFSDDRKNGDAFMSHAVAIWVAGRSAGGLLTTVTPNNLFFPLVLAAIITAIGLIVAYFLLQEPCDFHEEVEEEIFDVDEEVGNMKRRRSSMKRRRSSIILPEKIETVTICNIIGGAVLDYAGSIGLMSLALSPLMFQTFHYEFVEDGLDPVMSEQAFRILYSVLASSIVVGAVVAPMLFKSIGVATSCVLANIFTGCATISLLYIALIEPVSRVTFAMFTTVLYIGWSFSTTSFISTGPMLDRITPLEKKGFVQGLNGAMFDGSFALFPPLFALIVDNYGVSIAFWISTGLCCLSALVNLPLVFHPRMQAKDGYEEKGDANFGDSSRSGSTTELSTTPMMEPFVVKESDQHHVSENAMP